MAAKMTKTEESIAALGRLQTDMLRFASEGGMPFDKADEFAKTIERHVAVLARANARVLQAVRGELNDDRQ